MTYPPFEFYIIIRLNMFFYCIQFFAEKSNFFPNNGVKRYKKPDKFFIHSFQMQSSHLACHSE